MGISNQLFTGKERDNETGLDYFGARYLSATNGRFTSPDPHGGRVGHPQTMNRYSYVVNNPLVFVDPSGLECLYLNSKNEVQLVTDVSRENCGKTGGYYIKGVATDIKVEIVNGHREVLLSGTTNGHDSTFAFYQDTTLNIGWYQNSHTNPLGHIAVAVGNRTPVGLSTKQEGKFVLSVLWDSLTKPHRGAVDLDDTVVPGAIVEQNPKNLKEMVSIPITGMQAVLIQNFIDEQKNSPPPYSTGLNHGPACDCSTWAQEVMKSAGLKSGQPAPVPENLIRQLEHLYGPSHK
jgi:RHS repeat-associated protein